MAKRQCPQCGATQLRATCLDVVEASYDTTTGEWGNYDSLGKLYVTGVHCAECGAELDPAGMNFRGTGDLLRELLQVVLAYPWPEEGGVLLRFQEKLQVVYRRTVDAGPYAESPEEVAEALCQALGLAGFRTITFEEFALAAGAFDAGSWENVPGVVASMTADASGHHPER